MTKTSKKSPHLDLIKSAEELLQLAATHEPALDWVTLAESAISKAQEARLLKLYTDRPGNTQMPLTRAAQHNMARQELRLAAVQMIAAYIKAQEVKP